MRYARDPSAPDQVIIFDGNKGYPAGIQAVVPLSSTDEAVFNYTGSNFHVKGDFFGTEVKYTLHNAAKIHSFASRYVCRNIKLVFFSFYCTLSSLIKYSYLQQVYFSTVYCTDPTLICREGRSKLSWRRQERILFDFLFCFVLYCFVTYIIFFYFRAPPLQCTSKVDQLQITRLMFL